MDMSRDIAVEVERAEKRIRPHIRETYLEHSPVLSDLGGANVFLKLENLQHTGSFKARGAMNKLLSLSPEQRSRGCVAASTGNHGAAVAYGLNLLKAAGLIFVPMNAAETKVKTIERFGGVVRRQGMDGAETELFARRYAAERGMTYISPYNDLKVIAGQGTIAIELCRQMDNFDVLFASLGGGGLIAGIAAYIKARRSGVALIGCSPVNSQVMIESVRANRILELESLPTLSDGTAGGIEPGAITFDLCRALVEEYESVREDEIGKAIRLILEAHHLLVEGSAGVAVAAYLKRRDLYKGKNIVIVLCGANIGLLALRQVLALPEQAPL